jgi:hypothetical protein
VKIPYFIIVAIIAATSAWGVFGDIISSIPSPARYPQSLAWDGNYLWCFCCEDYMFYRVVPASGSVVSSFRLSLTAPGKGLAYAGGYLYHITDKPDVVYRITTTGSIVDWFSNPFAQAMRSGGFTYDGRHLWFTSIHPHIFWEMTTSGSVVSSFGTSFYPFDPAWDGDYLICGTYSPSHMLYRLTTTGSIVESAAPPANYPWGCCFDGTYMWVSTTVGSNYIWKLDAEGASAISPASVGKVKALFL